MLKIYNRKKLNGYINKRPGEVKFGEAVKTITELDELQTTQAIFVLLGIPEDIGVRANKGNAGTSGAWETCLQALLNIQANNHTRPENMIILGEIDCDRQMNAANSLDTEDSGYLVNLGKLVSEIDKMVATSIELIVRTGKIPIIIGGGHNNSYGNIKGTSLALEHSVNVINFDVHSDFRALEHRHSGNGFSYAFKEGYLNRYFIFGLQKNYSSQAIFDTIQENEDFIQFALFENIHVKKDKSFEKYLNDAETFIAVQKFGLELDLDSIENIPSSARTPAGFSVNQARRFIHYFGSNNNVAYLHLCEASPVSDNVLQTGKLLAYLITDFTEAQS